MLKIWGGGKCPSGTPVTTSLLCALAGLRFAIEVLMGDIIFEVNGSTIHTNIEIIMNILDGINGER